MHVLLDEMPYLVPLPKMSRWRRFRLTRRVSLKTPSGTFWVGLYCGERLWQVRRWYRSYGLFRRTATGFSIGPILFWKESWR